MQINLKKDVLVLTFPYSPKTVLAVRAINGRRYNPQSKNWEVPAQNVIETLEVLEPLGFRVHLEVRRYAEKRKAELEEVKELKFNPSKYTGKLPLYDFQKIGASFLGNLPGSLLADAPGLGKTIQTIAALENEKKVLILCPASLKYSWQEEILKWAENKYSTINSSRVIDGDKMERTAQWNSYARYYIANYELLLHDFDVMPTEWDAIVCDEAHRIANPMAKTTKALKMLISRKKIALSGTPISNTPVDLYSVLDWLSPGILGRYYHFLERYCVREPRFKRIIAYRNLDELARITERFMLRRTKEEVLKDFPPKTVKDILFNLSPKERKLYDAIRSKIVAELETIGDKKKNLAIIPVKMLRLKQAVDHPSLLTGKVEQSTKLDALKEILEPIMASNEKALIFTQFAEMAKLLFSELNIYEPRIIYGDVPAEERQKAVTEFNNDPNCKVMIMTEAGAYGLNLQTASYVIHYDLPWSVAKLIQREDRAHRIGQTKPVSVYNLLARDTIDEYVAKVLHKKQKISVDILRDADRLEDLGIEEEDIKNILRI
jgi:SNF2 family DNA or RNA helicase